MDNNSTYTPTFFENLGKLFYAIAASDHKVEAIEISTLKEIIKTHWAIVDSFDNDALEHIVFMFDRLNTDGHVNSGACYLDFVNYKNTQKHLFTDTIKHLILQTSNAIASSFSGRNKSELIMLAKLDIEFKK
jgi:hypothetical protein